MKSSLRVFAVLLASITNIVASSETVLWDFNSADKDPAFPYYNFLCSDSSGNLYGVTSEGGAYSSGAVFEISPNGKSGWTKKVLYSFPNDGSTWLIGGLALDKAGNLYGVSAEGGTNDTGYVYKLSPPATGEDWTKTIIHTFGKCCSKGPDGIEPFAGVVIDTEGRLYGTTSGGGVQGYGAIYELSLTNKGTWSERVLHSFAYSNEGGYPSSPLLLDSVGNLYGTNAQGGIVNYECPVGCGSVFKLAHAETGWKLDVLHLFNGMDGQYPRYSGVIMDKSGNLYGTTEGGGVIEGGAYGVGTVWELVYSQPQNLYNIEVLHNFPTGGSVDGVDLLAGVTMDSKGNLFGTTFEGGTYQAGSAFELIKGSNNQWSEKILHEFTNGADGGYPSGGLVLVNGKAFGMAEDGGMYNNGLVFEILP